MDEQKVDIYFRGDIAPGEKIVEVRERLKKLFKADDEQMQRLFSGRPAVIRRGLDTPAAEQYSEAMLKAGALVELRPVEPATESEHMSADSTADFTKVEPENVSESQQAPANAAPAPAGESGSIEQSPTGQAGKVAAQSGDFSIAPVGADMLNEGERTEMEAVEVDISALSAEAMSGDILTEDEKPKVEVVKVDISHLSVEDLPSQ